MRASSSKPPRAKCLERHWRLQKPRWEQASKQVLAPRYRSTGKSAAEGPNERLQAVNGVECQNDQTTSHEVWNNWWTNHLATYVRVVWLQRVSPDNWLTKCQLILQPAGRSNTKFPNSQRREYPAAIARTANNGESKMPILCFRVRALHHIATKTNAQIN